MLEQISQVEQTLPVGQFLGSNAWVVNAGRSASGAPLLANDPHIGFAAPTVWYEAQHPHTRQRSLWPLSRRYPVSAAGPDASSRLGPDHADER
ncbi:penicillin acylase family protein [Halopseudomonas pachastrellae]|nr:penicillin acylase family protein [Halopseudomonas pachastrellae]